MDDRGIFALAGRRLAWLAESRATIAGNIANANTPGYQARSVDSFEAHLASATQSRGLAVSHAGHLSATEASLGTSAVLTESEPTVHSGNSVNLDVELMKAGDIARSHALTTGVVRAFHRMTMSASRA